MTDTAKPTALARTDIAAHLHPYTNLATHPQVGPLVITGGDGCHVIDEHGRRYLEAMAGLWCASLGFSNRRLADAGAKALHTLPYYHTFNHRSNPHAIELAERLLAIAPVPMAKVFFANSGSEVNDTAVKLVWYYHNAIGQPAKKKILARTNAYHGVTVASASMGGLPINHLQFDLPIERFGHVTCPHLYRYGLPGETEDQFSTRLAEELERRILDEGPETVAAFIAEPVMGAGGVRVPPAGYFEKIQPVLRRHGVLLIADEVICGFGRTGAMWGSTTYGLQPDILTCAKALSSGYVPISALMVNERIARAVTEQSGQLGSFGHGYTYSGHPVAAAVAVETLKIYEELDIVARVQSLAPRFQQRLREFAGRPLVGEARGVGLVGAVEIVADKSTRAPFDPSRKTGLRLATLALEQGLIVRAMGDSIAFCPPLVIEPAEIETLFDRFDQALARLEAELQA